MRIALTGNPNSGKTTMYNALTGRNEKVGNWAGVTVDKKESPIKKHYYDGAEELIAVDLPGAYSMSPFTSEESITSASEVASVMGLGSAAALACLMFNLFTPPCFAAIGAMNSEMQSRKWLAGGICLQLGTGYTIGFLVYQIGSLITEGTLGTGFVPGLIAVAAMAAIVVYLIHKTNREIAAEYELKQAA